MKKGDKKLPIIPMLIGVIVLAVVIIVITRTVNKNDKDKYRLIKIESFEGGVELERDSNGTEIFSGMQLIPKDTVTTGEESLVELLADSDKHILAEENTCFSLESEGDEKKGKITITLVYGTSLFTIDNKLNEDSEFEVDTPNASLSVRGTTFRVNYDAATNTTTLEVIDGVVEAMAAKETRMVAAGENVLIRDDEFVSGEISVQEYIIKADSIYPDFIGELYVDDKLVHTEIIGDIYYTGTNFEAVEAYNDICAISYVINNGDDNFTVQKTDSDGLFISEDKSFSSLTGDTKLNVDNGADTNQSMARSELHNFRYIVCERDRNINPNTILGVGVIVSDTSQVSDGLSVLENKINTLKYNGIPKWDEYPRGENFWFHFEEDCDMPTEYNLYFDMTLEEYANFVGESFHTTGYIVSNTGDGDILFVETADGRVAIQSDKLKEGDILVFFSLDDVLLTPRTTAVYSTIQQGTYEGTVYDK